MAWYLYDRKVCGRTNVRITFRDTANLIQELLGKSECDIGQEQALAYCAKNARRPVISAQGEKISFFKHDNLINNKLNLWRKIVLWKCDSSKWEIVLEKGNNRNKTYR